MSRGLHHPITWLKLIASNLRRLVVFLVGVTMLGAGLAMLVLPGPGVIVILVGLAILASEFAWAERTLDRAKSRAGAVTSQLDDSRTARAALGLSALSLVGGGLLVALFADDRWQLGISAIVAGTFGMAVLIARSAPLGAGERSSEPPDGTRSPQASPLPDGDTSPWSGDGLRGGGHPGRSPERLPCAAFAGTGPRAAVAETPGRFLAPKSND